MNLLNHDIALFKYEKNLKTKVNVGLPVKKIHVVNNCPLSQ